MGTARAGKRDEHQRATDSLLQVVRIVGAAVDKEKVFREYWIWISQYPDAEPYFREAVKSVVKLNPTMLSELETQRALMIGVVVPAIIDPIAETELRKKCLQAIQRLETLDVYTELEVPVMHLVVREGPFRFGDVCFVDLLPESLANDLIARWAYELFDGRITCLAQVRAPGDSTKRSNYTEERVEEALRTLVGALWPLLVRSHYLVPVVVGHHPQPSATPFRQVGSQRFEESRGSLHAPGHSVQLPRHLEEHWGKDGLEALLGLAGTNFAGSKMAQRLAPGLGWLGEAAKPDTIAARMVKVATALEALIGGDPPREGHLTGRGITATLAERAAFLVGQNPEDRDRVHRDVCDYYDKRSDVLHRRGEVTTEEVADFGTLTWRVARSIVARLDELPDLEALAKWVLNQRYA